PRHYAGYRAALVAVERYGPVGAHRRRLPAYRGRTGPGGRCHGAGGGWRPATGADFHPDPPDRRLPAAGTGLRLRTGGPAHRRCSVPCRRSLAMDLPGWLATDCQLDSTDLRPRTAARIAAGYPRFDVGAGAAGRADCP